ncbi:helix-turn-helix domain-containing protein [Cryobacterium sp. Y57]|uniref:helix-turn-helix domain-containing protein n=1 Tax=Cryobacterium sp. Y57 TaxID=2048287 RepID=UPI00351A1582
MKKQARFWVKMAQGSTLTAACDAVGVNRRTGRRWRQATGGRIPLPEAERSGRFLSLEERLRPAADGSSGLKTKSNRHRANPQRSGRLGARR